MRSAIVLASAAFALTILAGVATGGSFALRGLASIPVAVLAVVLTCVFWMLLAVPFVVYAIALVVAVRDFIDSPTTPSKLPAPGTSAEDTRPPAASGSRRRWPRSRAGSAGST